MIAERFASLWGATTIDPVNPRDPEIVRMLGGGRDSIAGVRVDQDTCLGYPAIWRGVNILGNGLMKVRPLIYKRIPGGKERDHNHPSWRAITRQANPLMSAGICRKTITMHAALRGNGAAYLTRYGNGGIAEMTPLIPGKYGMVVTRGGRLLEAGEQIEEGDEISYWTTVGGRTKRLHPDDVLHIKGMTNNGYWGLDVIQLLESSIGLGIAARDLGARFFSQGGTASGLLTMPPGLKGDQQTEFRNAIKEGYTGLTKAHRFMILEEGAKFTPFTVDPNKAQVLQTREFEIREIANIIGIQSHKLGDSSRVSYNSLEQSNQEHLDDDLDPWLQVWEDELEAKGLTAKQLDDETHLVEFNRKQLVRTNLEARTNRHRFEREFGISSANDIIKQENGDPIGAVGDTYMVPANMMVLDKEGLPIVPEPPEPEPTEEPPADDSPAGPPRSQSFGEVAMHVAGTFTKRLCKEAQEASRKPSKFVAWLDGLASRECEPEVIAPTLRAVVEVVRSELDALTQPPYAAADLEQNVLLAMEGLEHRAIETARTLLEPKE